VKIKLNRFLFVACTTVLLLPLSAFSQVTVIFTRHAEKAATPANDPPLTAAGEQRAKILASMLADSGVEAIYVTELHRTQQTAAPLAARTHLTPVVIPANDTDTLVKAIRERKSGVVVVVGHSNKVPEIIAKLGGPAVRIPDTDYDNLFILTVGATHSSLLRLHYGDSAPVLAPGGKMDPAMTGGPVK
jgi:phosphohistidine phosphatase SixA